jgi:hypothetical protein
MMNLRIYDPRILAIELRHRRFGFAVFEGHRSLLDWGVRAFPAVGELEARMARDRLAGLITLFAPSAIVIKKERWERAETNPHILNLVEALENEAFARSVPIRLLEHAAVVSTFLNLGCETREQIAEALCRIFPELTPSMPLKRKSWKAEHPRMRTFDAIALGLAYWQHESIALPNLVERQTQ